MKKFRVQKPVVECDVDQSPRVFLKPKRSKSGDRNNGGVGVSTVRSCKISSNRLKAVVIR